MPMLRELPKLPTQPTLAGVVHVVGARRAFLFTLCARATFVPALRTCGRDVSLFAGSGRMPAAAFDRSRRRRWLPPARSSISIKPGEALADATNTNNAKSRRGAKALLDDTHVCFTLQKAMCTRTNIRRNSMERTHATCYVWRADSFNLPSIKRSRLARKTIMLTSYADKNGTRRQVGVGTTTTIVATTTTTTITKTPPSPSPQRYILPPTRPRPRPRPLRPRPRLRPRGHKPRRPPPPPDHAKLHDLCYHIH